ncbi:unnamed protein product [Leptidea sinapis]|uniref:Uncharacterized protein n=1 Tax=Leptidea sinapis TaxID=189913 RepID=A0A5E4PNB2_9NEOP|nr:unnamed protein product [Leptidea sinapis]
MKQGRQSLSSSNSLRISSQSIKKAQTDVVKWQAGPLRAPLLRLAAALHAPALECFTCVRAYCGDLPPAERAAHADLTEVKCVYTVLMVTAVSAGRSARRQLYRLPGGAERVVNTRCATVVQDIVDELCDLVRGGAPAAPVLRDAATVAALLHRAAGLPEPPHPRDLKFLLPKPLLALREPRPNKWASWVAAEWPNARTLSPQAAKSKVLQVRSEDGTLFLDVKCGSLLQQRVSRLQAEQAHEIARLIRQYIALQRERRHDAPEFNSQ